jgi:soluble lytic murein transglycosylase
MKTIAYWGMIIPDPWFKNRFRNWFRNAAIAALAVLRIADPLRAADASENRLGQGINAYNLHDYNGAIQHLRGLQLPKLSDYVAYYLASAEMQTGDNDAAARDLTLYRAHPIASTPLGGKLALITARALLERHVASANAQALEILQTDYRMLPQPDGDLTLAMAYETQGEKLQAALSYVKVYYGSPNTDAAARAWDAMTRLKAEIGKDFPSAPPRQQLDRCQKWLDARQYANAKQEYAALAQSLPEPERDEARVGLGAVEFLSGETAAPLKYLRDLKVARSQADAQRLYYIAEISKKMGDDAEMMNSVKLLNERYGPSVWRLKALVSAGNRYVATGDKERYAPLFKAASDSFPADISTAYCHWKITWDAYLGDKADRVDLLREQIERYPADSRTGTALYFLGRVQEKQGKPAEARAYYERVSAQFPHYFYGTLARERLADAKIASLKPDETTLSWLNDVAWPEHRDFTSTEPNAATRLRIDRARILMAAGLADVADAELRFGAKTETEQPHLLALELARSMPSPFQSLRIMKSFIADYLAIPFESAPLQFWQMLFPLPYKEDVVHNAKERGLDPYSVAALIRQETEFNPDAHSPANAYGLMQLVLPTGKTMGRAIGVPVTSSRSLMNPSVNIQLGTEYLKGQLSSWDGDWTRTLAAYNAGPSRVRGWLSASNFREPAEFVESIPFNETREYVQAVMRNAEMYRTIYGEKHPGAREVKEMSELPRVNLASLPVAARTPGGGVRTTTATKSVASRSKKGASAKPAVNSKRAPAKKSEAAKKAPPKKKKGDAA